jgi:NAD(P)H-binding
VVSVDDLPGQLERSQFLGEDAEQERRGVLALQRLVADGDPDGDIIAERGEDRRRVERLKCLAVPGPPSGHAASIPITRLQGRSSFRAGARRGSRFGRVRLLVVGATGGLGRLVVAEGARRGHHVAALVRDPARAGLPEPVQMVRGDVLEPVSLDPAVQARDAVICALGNPSPRKPSTLLADGTRNLVEAMRRAGVPRLVCSRCWAPEAATATPPSCTAISSCAPSRPWSLTRKPRSAWYATADCSGSSCGHRALSAAGAASCGCCARATAGASAMSPARTSLLSCLTPPNAPDYLRQAIAVGS